MEKIQLKKQAEVERMRTAGTVVARALESLRAACKPGVTTAELDGIAAAVIKGAGGRASFLNYKVGSKIFPSHICASVNEEIVHGIPGKRALRSGDIISVDVGVLLDGFHADSAATFPVGVISSEAARLLEVTEQSLWAGIAEAKVGNRVGSIAAAIQRYAESRGYFVVKTLVGHGVGRNLHEAPQVPNFGSRNSGEKLTPGMTIAIEPMINVGTEEILGLDDDWTIVTADGSLSAHFEHTVAITREGPDVLTVLPGAGARARPVRPFSLANSKSTVV